MTIGADKGELAEVGSPVAIDGDPVDHHAPLAWTTTVLVSAALLLAVTNAASITDWVDALPQDGRTARLRDAAMGWERATAALGGPHRWMRGRWQAAQDRRFGAEQPGEPGDTDAR